MKKYNKIYNKFISIILAIIFILCTGYFTDAKYVEAADNYVGQTWNYSYCGYVSSWTAPIYAIYKLEVYGAGGDSYGGYSSGYIKVEKGKTLYICCGGHGGVSTSSGGYNGGGNGTSGNAVATLGSGGGATHIATTNRGVLANYKNYQSEVLIAAGGGGGRCAFTDYANEDDKEMPNRWSTNGGGLTSNSTRIGGAGFGKGQDASGGTYCAAGGGGFYGGNNIGGVFSGGKGGTGYIGGVPSFSFNDITYSPSSAQGAGAGAQANGYAKITLAAFLIYITTTDAAVAPEDANFTSEASFAYLNVASFKIQRMDIGATTAMSTTDSDWTTLFECSDLTEENVTEIDNPEIEYELISKTLFDTDTYAGTIKLKIPVNDDTAGYYYRIIGYMADNYEDSSAFEYITCRYTTANINVEEAIINEDGTGILEVNYNDGTTVEYSDSTIKNLQITADVAGALSYKWQYRYEGDNDESVWIDVNSGNGGRVVTNNYNTVTKAGTSTLTISDTTTDMQYSGTNVDADDGIYYRLLITHSAGSTGSNESSLNNQQTIITSKVMKLYVDGNKIKRVYLVTDDENGNKTYTELKGIVFDMPTGDSVNRRDYLYYGY